MFKRAIEIVQTTLRSKGFFAGNPSGIPDAATDAAAAAFIGSRAGDCPPGASGLPPKRRLVMSYQLICKDRGIDCDPIDGFWGPVTENAHNRLVHLIENGTLPPNWRDQEPATGNPRNWPRDTPSQVDMRDFYGNPGAPPMKTVRCPWTLRLAWDLSSKTTKISCHQKVADSLEKVLNKVFDTYGEADLRRLRLDLYGGCFAPRRKRGGSTWSTHAWAVALDFDPDRNKLEWGRDRATLDASVYDDWWAAWESEGWLSLGRQRNFDWMHVQAARL